MKRTLLIIVLFGFGSFAFGQTATLVQPLGEAVSESSGLIILNGRFITHNDSGGEAALYEIDTLSGNIARTVTVSGVENTDWEDIAVDENYIYIGDFGNNAGNRTDLRIQRIEISDYLSTPTDDVSAETIFFSYNDQTDFSDATFTTNFDAEAMTVVDGVIFVFTKNWGNQQTNMYQMPAAPGTHSAVNSATINAQGFVTSANYNLENGQLTLLGHSLFLQPFVIEISNFENGEFETFVKTNFTLPTGFSGQTEAIAEINAKYYLSSEASFAGISGLFRMSAPYVTTVQTQTNHRHLRIYPNPATDKIFIETENFKRAEILDLSGKSLLTSNEVEVDVSSLSTGVYILSVWSKLADDVARIKFAVVK